jgi:hypothetical protein
MPFVSYFSYIYPLSSNINTGPQWWHRCEIPSMALHLTSVLGATDGWMQVVVFLSIQVMTLLVNIGNLWQATLEIHNKLSLCSKIMILKASSHAKRHEGETEVIVAVLPWSIQPIWKHKCICDMWINYQQEGKKDNCFLAPSCKMTLSFPKCWWFLVKNLQHISSSSGKATYAHQSSKSDVDRRSCSLIWKGSSVAFNHITPQ